MSQLFPFLFQNCLGIIYTVFIENLQFSLESIIGNILGCVHIPPPGGPQVRFSIGAGDRQALQPPLSSTIPVTNCSVALIFTQLGIKNVLSLFTAVLTDHKVLILSQSYTRLTDACHALNALLYPLRYTYVYIPILPISLLEVLNAPTPFLAGIHSSLSHGVSDLLDVIIADLDGGSIMVPECIHLPEIPDALLNRTMKALTMILKPELLTADDAFPALPKKSKPPDRKDKELRAVFIRLFAELFTGYRSCLTLIRIHPEPFITFHKAYFLGQRGMVDDDFTCKVLDCMSFSSFVAERGPPYRVCDIFDEVYATMQDQLKEERATVNGEKMMAHIKEIAQQLFLNENPNSQPYVPKLPKPTEGAYARIHQLPFPHLDRNLILEIIDEGTAKLNLKNKLSVRPQQPRIVPMGPPISSVVDKQKIVDNNARRLEVLRNCINFIFENKISDARKIFPAVLRALNNKVARLALTQELSYHIQSNRAMLEHQQFDLVVRLLNCALQDDSSMDENGVAYAILPLATSFCRKLCTGVIQFAYTCVQEHAVWRNQQFWEAAFYLDVQKQIRQLYLPHYEEHFVSEHTREEAKSANLMREVSRDRSLDASRSKSCTPDIHRRSAPCIYRPKEIGALDIAAEQLRVWPTLSKEQQEEMINNEESTVYSQAIHYANRMVYMLIPLDVNRREKNSGVGFDEKCASNSNITASLAESDSLDAESGFDETEASDVGANVIRFVTRFVDKVCSDSSVTQDHLKSLHQMIPGVVAMHIETLESIHRESKRLPPIQKPKILLPTILPGEEIVMDGLRVYLLPDGREEGVGGSLGGPCLLPAEGAVFLTTYRIIFKGIPCDPLACEQIVVRCFPVSTLTREKRISVQYLQHLDQWLHEGLQLRSSIFQLMKIVFDEEVGSDNVETFRKLVHKVRNPVRVFDTFTFVGHSTLQPTPIHKQKEKNATIKQFAKKTLIKTVRKAGLKPKQSSRKQKYMLPTPPSSRRSLSPRSSDSESERPNSEAYDELSIFFSISRFHYFFSHSPIFIYFSHSPIFIYFSHSPIFIVYFSHSPIFIVYFSPIFIVYFLTLNFHCLFFSLSNFHCLFFLTLQFSLFIFLTLQFSLFIFLTLQFSLFIFLTLQFSLFIFLTLQFSLCFFSFLSNFHCVFYFLSLQFSLCFLFPFSPIFIVFFFSFSLCFLFFLSNFPCVFLFPFLSNFPCVFYFLSFQFSLCFFFLSFQFSLCFFISFLSNFHCVFLFPFFPIFLVFFYFLSFQFSLCFFISFLSIFLVFSISFLSNFLLFFISFLSNFHCVFYFNFSLFIFLTFSLFIFLTLQFSLFIFLTLQFSLFIFSLSNFHCLFFLSNFHCVFYFLQFSLCFLFPFSPIFIVFFISFLSNFPCVFYFLSLQFSLCFLFPFFPIFLVFFISFLSNFPCVFLFLSQFSLCFLFPFFPIFLVFFISFLSNFPCVFYFLSFQFSLCFLFPFFPIFLVFFISFLSNFPCVFFFLSLQFSLFFISFLSNFHCVFYFLSLQFSLFIFLTLQFSLFIFLTLQFSLFIFLTLQFSLFIFFQFFHCLFSSLSNFHCLFFLTLQFSLFIFPHSPIFIVYFSSLSNFHCLFFLTLQFSLCFFFLSLQFSLFFFLSLQFSFFLPIVAGTRSNYSEGSPSVIDEAEFSTSWSADPKSLEKLMERPGYQDYQRLGIGSLPGSGSRSRTDAFRITLVNSNYSVCRSYPALLVVPHSVTDESIRKFARCYRQSRFPVITWRHSRTKALLIRASGFHSRSLMGMLRHHNTVSGTSTGETSASIEQENYFRSLVAATPNSMRTYQSSYSDSLTSLDSLMMVGNSELTIPETPEPLRKTTFSRAPGLSSIRTSANAKSKTLDLSSPVSITAQSPPSSSSATPGTVGSGTASSATMSASVQSAETKQSSATTPTGIGHRNSMISRASSTILAPTFNGGPLLSFPRRRRRSGYWQSNDSFVVYVPPINPIHPFWQPTIPKASCPFICIADSCHALKRFDLHCLNCFYLTRSLILLFIICSF
ncbi:SBF1_2 [Acanthosepion pharaonis]|uniref:SBF1_2 n=1 Tax=Acanthosepion pharaonis TaxID=158019 RepID=A0A812BU88_ACAPH|nr:SBF1_2 [Sepia pharaonis]